MSTDTGAVAVAVGVAVTTCLLAVIARAAMQVITMSATMVMDGASAIAHRPTVRLAGMVQAPR